MNSQNISAKESEESKMEKITSFTIDHIKLQPGIYVSRKDPVGGSMITTFDIRMTSPNEEPVMNTAELHTIEHLAATFLRNHKEFGSKMIYWGPMGCRTGNYLLLNGDYESKDIVPLMIETFEFIRDFEGEVPGASAKDCGNYLDMNLPMAKYLAGKDSETVTIIGPGVMGRTCLLAFLSVCPKITTVKVKGRGLRSLHAFEEFVKKECPQIQQVIVCDSMEEAVKDSDIICVTSTAPVKEIDFPYIAEDWVKKGALICLPSAARFDDDFLINRCKKVVDNYKLYEAWAEEFPYPSYEMVQIIGSKFTDYLHEGRIQREDIVDIADIINKKHPGRESDDEIIVYSVGGMPVEDIAWGGTVYRNALKEGIGVELPLWDQPDMA